MSDIGAMVSELISAGCSPEVAARVVTQAFIAGSSSVTERDMSRDESVTHKREVDRLRKQRWRDRHAMSRDNRDMSRDAESVSLSKERKKEEIKEERGERKVASRGHRLPDDWVPSPQDRVTAFALLGEPRTAVEIDKFRDHWKQQPGTKGVKLDWDAAWRNWIRRAAEYGENRNGHGYRTSSRRSSSSDFFAGIASVAADLNGDSAPPRTADPEIPLGRVNIDG